MARGREETSTSGRPGKHLRATPSASNIISSLTMEELMAYCEVPDKINLRLMERAEESTLSGEHNSVFFTREHLAVGLRFPVPAIVKQFLHFTRAPPAFIYPNMIRILIGSCVLNHLYQLDISLVELFMIYFLGIGPGGWMSMSILSLRLQIVNGLPDSPKTEAKGALLVRGPWDETSGSPGRRIDQAFLGRLAFRPNPFEVPGRRIGRALLGRLAFGPSPFGALGLGRLAWGSGPGPMVPTNAPFFLPGRNIIPGRKKKSNKFDCHIIGNSRPSMLLNFQRKFCNFLETALDAIGSLELVLRFRGSYKRLMVE